MAELSEVGLVLNADKTVILTTQSQPPSTITTDHGLTLRVLSGNVAQKWLGCMLSAYGSEQKFLDLQYHLQQAAKSYHANKWILEDRRVPISQCLRYFDAVVSSVACFAGGHRTIYQEHIQTLDLHFRKFCRSIVGPPPYTDWTLEWHEILHARNERAAHFVGVSKIQSWSRILLCFILETGGSHCQTSHSSLDTKNFALATRGAKAAWAAQTPLGEQIGDVLSLPRIGSLGGSSTKL